MEEELANLLPEQPTTCASCNSAIIEDTAFCADCGYPLKATPEEQSHFIAHRQLKKGEQEKHLKKIRQAKIALYILSALSGILTIIISMSSGLQRSMGLYDTDLLAIGMVILGLMSITYLACAIWSDKKPFAALLVGFTFYATIQLATIIIEPSNAYRGILFKVLFFVFLLNGFISANKLKKLDKELAA